MSEKEVLHIVIGWFKKKENGNSETFGRDPYGFSIKIKPRFPLQKWFERVAGHVSVPEDRQESLRRLCGKGVVVYTIKEPSQIDFVYISMRLRQLGLPAPVFMFDQRPYPWQPRWYALKTVVKHFIHLLRQGCFPDPYAGGYYADKINSGNCGLFPLVGKRGYYRSTVLVGNDPLEHLIDIQKSCAKPIYIVPVVLLYNRRPEGRHRWGPLEMFLGQRKPFGFLRKMASFVRGNPYAVMETGEPLNIREILPELSEEPWQRRKQIFELRRSLIDSVDEIKRAVTGPTIKSKLEMKEIILHHPKLEAMMERRARTSSQQIWKVRMEADSYLEEIAANYSVNFIQIASKIFNWVWNNLFDGVELDYESLQEVKRAARNNTLVYIPSHKSHMDYLLFSQLLYSNNLYPPFIAAGKNLAFWPLGSIFRRGGAFFIRRAFKGKFYAEVFSLYVKTMVQLGHNIEYFIEGGRSRTGKLVLPKLGLLTILIQAVEQGYCEDLVFVPASICYDRIPEAESYLNEVIGNPKEEENLGQLVKVRRIMRKRYGRAYIKFAQPISLRRYLESQHHSIDSMRPKERHAMYRNFAYRIINCINEESVVTPFALAAAAMLAMSNHGISKAEFLEISQIFHDFIAARGAVLSKTMKNLGESLQESLRNMERNKLIGKLKDEDDDLEEEVFTLEDSKRLALEYYKNNIIHFLLPAAYVATSILAQQTFRFSVSQTLEDVIFMKNFFKFEFVYDNELSDEKLLGNVFDIFEKLEFLTRIGEGGDQPFILAHSGLRACHAFHGLLRNYFEGYWLVLRGLRYLQKNSFSEKDFMKKLLSLGQKALKLGLVERPECVSKITFDNALRLYVEKNIIIKSVGAEKENEEQLRPGPESRDSLQLYSKQISRFLRSPHFALQ